MYSLLLFRVVYILLYSGVCIVYCLVLCIVYCTFLCIFFYKVLRTHCMDLQLIATSSLLHVYVQKKSDSKYMKKINSPHFNINSNSSSQIHRYPSPFQCKMISDVSNIDINQISHTTIKFVNTSSCQLYCRLATELKLRVSWC